jgi:hypothetical protein
MTDHLEVGLKACSFLPHGEAEAGYAGAGLETLGFLEDGE